MRVEGLGCVLIAVSVLLAACTSNPSTGSTAQRTDTALLATPAHRLDRIALSVADIGDASTTTIGLVSGVAEEVNPIVRPFGAAAGLAIIPVKIGLKHVIVGTGKTPAQANVWGNTAGSLTTCSNASVIAGATLPTALAAGAICAAIYNREAKRSYREITGRNIDGSWVIE